MKDKYDRKLTILFILMTSNKESDSCNCGIYCWTNKVNGKKYIGQSKRLKFRKYIFFNFGYPYAGSLIDNARKKYNSPDDWTYEILEYCEPKDLDEKEQMYIYLFNTYNRDLGYNLTIGGEGSRGYELSDETIERIKTSEYILNRQRAIYQIDYRGNIINSFSSATEAERQTGFRHSNIISTCKGKYSQCNGFKWVYVDEYDSQCDYSFEINRKKSPILQYDINGHFLKEWSNTNEAVKVLGCSKVALCNALNGVSLTCKKSYWCYKDESVLEKMNKKMTEKMNLVLQIDNETGEVIREWKNARIAEIAFKGKATSAIHSVLKGKNKSAYGFFWRYKNSPD